MKRLIREDWVWLWGERVVFAGRRGKKGSAEKAMDENLMFELSSEWTWESLVLEGDQLRQSWMKSTLNIHWMLKLSSNTLSTWCKGWLIGKDPDAGKDWWQKEKGVAEDEMVGWHHWLNGRELEQTLGDSGGQGILVAYSPWSHKQFTGVSNWLVTTSEWTKKTSSKEEWSWHSSEGKCLKAAVRFSCSVMSPRPVLPTFRKIYRSFWK